MGSCLSLVATDFSFDISTAKVITSSGNLREYLLPVTVSQVLEIETFSYFLCNSDRLFFDDYIPALDSSEELQAGQIYFVLPTNRLQDRLTAPNMAALAVKASSALSQSLRKNDRWNKKIQISPVLDLNNSQRVEKGGWDGYDYDGFNISTGKSIIGVTRSRSIKKLKKNSSRRTNFAIQSFRMRLKRVFKLERSVWDQAAADPTHSY